MSNKHTDLQRILPYKICKILAYDIKIYGEISPYEEGCVSLAMVQEQLSKANGQDIRVRINSIGGDLYEGTAIYSELRRYAKENNAKVTTLAEGMCASVATVFFLAGDERIVTEFTQPFVHNAICGVWGNSKEMQTVVDELEVCNDMIAKHYEKHTDLTYEEARLLMDNNTYISPEECVRLRFATSIEQVVRPAALMQIINKSNKNVKMAKEGKKVQAKNQNEKSFMKMLREFFNKDVYTADNQIIDFYELDDNESVKVGDKANIDGKPAQGEVVVANGDIYVFEAGELMEIREATPSNLEEPADPGTEDPEKDEVTKLQERVAELETELEERDNQIEELESMLEKASNKMNQQEQVIKNFKDASSKFAGDQRRQNPGNSGAPANKSEYSDAVEKFAQSRFKTK